MMDLINDEGLSSITFRQMRAGTGEMMGVIAVRGTFHIYPGHPLIFAEPQDPIQLEDRYLGDPHNTPLIRCSDLVPHKPKADLTLIGWAAKPRHYDQNTWRCGLVFDGNTHAFEICGNREWQYEDDQYGEEPGQNGKWALSEPDESVAVKLSWENTYGGVFPTDQDGGIDAVRENPIGCGFLHPEFTPKSKPVRAPNILRPHDQLPEDGDYYEPYGCAPIPPWWRQRQQYTGTYDQAWLDEVHPRLPADFDYHFYQCAPAHMIYPSYFKGGEAVSLIHLRHDFPQIEFTLPEYRPFARIRRITNEVVDLKLNLDGCHIDLTEHPAKVFLTWRAWLPFTPEIRSFDLKIQNLGLLIKQRASVSKLTPLNGVTPWN